MPEHRNMLEHWNIPEHSNKPEGWNASKHRNIFQHGNILEHRETLKVIKWKKNQLGIVYALSQSSARHLDFRLTDNIATDAMRFS